jgi:hypothetical protein
MKLANRRLANFTYPARRFQLFTPGLSATGFAISCQLIDIPNLIGQTPSHPPNSRWKYGDFSATSGTIHPESRSNSASRAFQSRSTHEKPRSVIEKLRFDRSPMQLSRRTFNLAFGNCNQRPRPPSISTCKRPISLRSDPTTPPTASWWKSGQNISGPIALLPIGFGVDGIITRL